MDNSSLQINREEVAKFLNETKLQSNEPTKNLTSSKIKSSEDSFIFFLLDIVEWNAGQPGLLYLFGQTYDNVKGCFVSCCVSVKYCHKRAYLLPRKYFYDNPEKEVSWKDIYDEFYKKVAPEIETRKVEYRTAIMKYAFDQTIPPKTEYFEVKCEAGNFKLRDQPGNTYSRILGTHVGYEETFILERNIKGPCWLQVSNFKKYFNSGSHCKINIQCFKIEDITAIQINIVPPITMMGLEIKNMKNEHTNKEDVISVSCIVEVCDDLFGNEKVSVVDYFCILSTATFSHDYRVLELLKNSGSLKIHIVHSEIELLDTLFECIFNFDPDILYGHNLIGHYANLLYSKIIEYPSNLTNFHKMSKLRLKQIPPVAHKKDIFIGRISWDTKLLTEEMIKLKTYTIHELSVNFLKIPHSDIETESLKIYLQNLDNVLDLVYSAMWDIACVHKFMEKLNILQLLFEVTRLCGNPLRSIGTGSLMNMCVYLLLHKFHEKDYIVPSRYVNRSKRRTMNIEGGLVLEPDIGLYRDFVLSMDFNALYPSIIQEYNVCFTTIKEKNGKIIKVDGEGVLPELIGGLIHKRRCILQELTAKSNNQSSDYLKNLEIKQRLVKKITNSIYGYLACSGSRFLAEHVASFITSKGREILVDTVSKLTEHNYKIIYGDTDSVMIKTNLKGYQEVEALSRRLEDLINSRYKFVRMEKAGIYKPFFILLKKKYAGIKFESEGRTVEEIKGVDVIRRDWSGISTMVGKSVLNKILSCCEDLGHEIYSYLQNIQADLIQNSNKYDYNFFLICKKLNKDPENYGDYDSDHVNLALKHNKMHPDKFKAGDIVCYVICVDGTSRNLLHRAYLVEEFRKSNSLKIDIRYYISNQIYPVVKRICNPIKAIITNEDLLTALNVDFTKCIESRKCNRPKIEKKAEYDPVHNFIMTCTVCKDDQFISYESLDFVKFCLCVNSRTTNIEDFKDHLTIILNDILFSFKSKKRTFMDSEYIMKNIQEGIECSKVNDNQLPEYLNIINEYRQVLLRDASCKDINLKEMFKFCNVPSF